MGERSRVRVAQSQKRNSFPLGLLPGRALESGAPSWHFVSHFRFSSKSSVPTPSQMLASIWLGVGTLDFDENLKCDTKCQEGAPLSKALPGRRPNGKELRFCDCATRTLDRS